MYIGFVLAIIHVQVRETPSSLLESSTREHSVYYDGLRSVEIPIERCPFTLHCQFSDICNPPLTLNEDIDIHVCVCKTTHTDI